jgi:hypothetical protein
VIAPFMRRIIPQPYNLSRARTVNR